MSYPSNPGGYGAQQPDPQQYRGPATGGIPAAPAPAGRGLGFMLNLGVVGLGVVTFLMGFAPYAKDSHAEGGMFGGEDNDSINFFANFGMGVGVIGLALLLTAALIAAFGLLPKQESNGPVVAALSLAGFLTLLFLMIGIVDGLDSGAGLILTLVTSFLQTVLAIGAVLVSSDIIKMNPAPRYAPYPAVGYAAPPPQPGYPGGNPAGSPGGNPAGGPGGYQAPPGYPPAQPPQSYDGR